MRSGAAVITSWPGELNTRHQKAASPTIPIGQAVAGSPGASDVTDTTTGEEVYYRLTEPY